MIAAKLATAVALAMLVAPTSAAPPREGSTTPDDVPVARREADRLFDEAMGLANRGKTRPTIDALGRVIRLDPRHRRAYLQRGFIYQRLADYPAAIRDLGEAIRLDRRDFAALYARASLYNRIGRHDLAVPDCTEVIRLNPMFLGVYVDRAWAFAELGRYREAVADCDEAIRLNPLMPMAYNNRADALAKSGDPGRALGDCEMAIRMFPGDPHFYDTRGDAYNRLGQYDRAIRDLDTAIAMDPGYAVAHRNRGVARLALGDLDAAFADFDRAIALAPRLAPAHADRALAALILGRGDCARDARAYLALKGWGDPRSPAMVLVAHIGLRRLGRDAEAGAVLAEGLRRCDFSAWPYPILRRLHGSITTTELMAKADDPSRKAEARAYVGLDHALSGRRDEARDWLGRALAEGEARSDAHRLAAAELRRLDEARAGPTDPGRAVAGPSSTGDRP